MTAMGSVAARVRARGKELYLRFKIYLPGRAETHWFCLNWHVARGHPGLPRPPALLLVTQGFVPAADYPSDRSGRRGGIQWRIHSCMSS